VLAKMMRYVAALNMAVVAAALIGILVFAKGRLAMFSALPIALLISYFVAIVCGVPLLMALRFWHVKSLPGHIFAAVALGLTLGLIWLVWQSKGQPISIGLAKAAVETIAILISSAVVGVSVYWGVLGRYRH
jgi:hypothetical protein